LLLLNFKAEFANSYAHHHGIEVKHKICAAAGGWPPLCPDFQLAR
jgi:hypothetical protein